MYSRCCLESIQYTQLVGLVRTRLGAIILLGIFQIENIIPFQSFTIKFIHYHGITIR